MRTLRYMVLALLAILLVAVIIGFFLPSKAHLERSIEINRDKHSIFKVINSLSDFNKWSPWYDYDVYANYEVSGAKAGVSSKLVWSGNDKIGSGSNEIIESVDDDYIKTKFYFGKSDAPAFSTISLKQDGEKTKVTWAFDNDFGYNVFYRYFGLVLEDMVSPDYERGLKKLKSHVESLPLFDYSNISVVETASEKAYAFQAASSQTEAEITPIIASAYGKIINFITENKLSMAGTPKIVNLKFTDNNYLFLAVIPVDDTSYVDENNEIFAFETYKGKAIKLIHSGSYSNFKKSYEVLNAYIEQNKIKRNGNSWEDFVTDPEMVSEKDLVTHIYQPIK